MQPAASEERWAAGRWPPWHLSVMVRCHAETDQRLGTITTPVGVWPAWAKNGAFASANMHVRQRRSRNTAQYIIAECRHVMQRAIQ